jgi:hypothetical protein
MYFASDPHNSSRNLEKLLQVSGKFFEYIFRYPDLLRREYRSQFWKEEEKYCRNL